MGHGVATSISGKLEGPGLVVIPPGQATDVLPCRVTAVVVLLRARGGCLKACFGAHKGACQLLGQMG
eukprot:1532508-Alexandrium_andersonii.AAC.1